MKIENINLSSSELDQTTVTLSALSHRIGAELSDLANICRNVENALGVVISPPKETIDQPIMALQGLDRLRQTLEDLARLTQRIGHSQAFSNDAIQKEEILKTLVLNGLAARLIKSGIAVGDNPSRQDEIWS